MIAIEEQIIIEEPVINDYLRERLGQSNSKSIKSFMGLPHKKTFDGEDFCIMGVPYDTSTTNRPGTRFGPRAVREYPASFGKYNQDSDWVLDNVTGMDFGDLPVLLGYTRESMELIYEGTKNILENNAIPIIIGGDHLITYAELRAYAEKYGPVAMVHFDSHNDTTEMGRGDELYNHGTPFRRAIEEGFLDASHSIQVGIRGYVDKYRLDYAAENKMEVITARELHEIGIEEAADRIKKQVGTAKCIVTFDIDFLDPSAAPGTGTPVPGGFTTYEAMEIIREAVGSLEVVGYDLVEVMEDYDPAHITALAAGHIIYEFVTCISKRKKQLGEQIL